LPPGAAPFCFQVRALAPAKGDMMSIEALKSRIPDFAKDVRLNLSSMASDETLTPEQKYGLFVACGIASRNPVVRAALAGEAAQHVGAATIAAAKSAAAIMGMNNVYYRFQHLVSNPEYKTMPARLRMNAMANPGVPKLDFELWSLAVSAINGCAACMDSHEDVLRKGGLPAATIHTAVRFAAVIQSAAIAIEAADVVEGAESVAA
jgi:alkyl hydroperoxide reductase subunit D